MMTNLHYRLMTPLTSGFILKDKQWSQYSATIQIKKKRGSLLTKGVELIDVGSLEEVPATADPLQYLVLNPEDLKLLKSLSHQQSSGTAWTADFIQGKGVGQIVLLHGPPGVGKTYTVECIAESFGRSLLSLTVADLGMEEIAIEERLDAWFSLAEVWRAVLLIDEADVFLERRSRNDIRRNALVAG
jgi:SpoVK/Ycf46/Vps4 family AAA+-type ATPase